MILAVGLKDGCSIIQINLICVPGSWHRAPEIFEIP